MAKTIHPFPARMAPELALMQLAQLPEGSLVLDPMVGSGTVVRHASALGHTAIGFDVDPLAVLISNASTVKAKPEQVREAATLVLSRAKSIKLNEVYLPWIDDDEQTKNFVEYWFGIKQRNSIRKVVDSINKLYQYGTFSQKIRDVLYVCLSKIIVTKDRGASLGRDVSHSRPHKTMTWSDFDVLGGFSRAVELVCRYMSNIEPCRSIEIKIGDARKLDIDSNYVDLLLTSPPYLNAIDYMRGHRLALVWLGYSISHLRDIRSGSIGSERSSPTFQRELFGDISESMVDTSLLTRRNKAIVERYAEDCYYYMSESYRVLKHNAKATFVIGNSCLKGVFIKTSAAIITAGERLGFRIEGISERDLPSSSRYLPLTGQNLSKRMRTETIIQFTKP